MLKIMETTNKKRQFEVAEIQLSYKSKVKPSQRPKITSSRDASSILLEYWDADKLEFIEKFNKVLEGQGVSAPQVDEWGVRDLAYRIEKQSRGYYTLLRYRANGRAVEELERNLKLTDGILRYMTVRADEENVATNPVAAARALIGR